MEDCPRCKGVGKVNTASEDEAKGAAMRRLREREGKSLRFVAGKLDKSPAYLSRLERGRERWNPVIERNYLDVVEGKQCGHNS